MNVLAASAQQPTLAEWLREQLFLAATCAPRCMWCGSQRTAVSPNESQSLCVTLHCADCGTDLTVDKRLMVRKRR